MSATFDRRSIRAHHEAFAGRPEEATLETVRGAIARGDFDEALARALVRAEAGERLPGELVRALATDATSVRAFLIVVAIAEERGVAEALVELVERDRMPVGPGGVDLVAAALWAAWRLGDREALRARVLRAVRIHTRGTFGDEGAALLVELARELGDADLRARLRKLAAPGDAAIVAAAAKLLEMPAAALVEELPADEPTRAVPGFTVRVAARPGRNEPCPCGSGKKYKRCCAERDDAAPAASPVAGMSWDEYLRAGAPRLTADEIDALPLRDLARVDLAGLGRVPRLAALRRAIALRRWDLAARVIDVLADRQEADVDDWRAEVIAGAVDAGELEVARAHAARITDPDAIGDGDRVRLALHERPGDALALLEEAAARALRVEAAEPGRAVELAYGVLAASPALGILLARAVVGTGHPLDVETLLETVEDARIGLDLPEGDSGWEVWSALAEEEEGEDDGERARLSAQSRQLTAALTTAQRRAADLERELGGLRARLDAPPTAASAPAPVDPAERRALRDRVETLEARIREGNEERLDLRRRLAAASSEARRDAEPAAARSDDDEPGDDLPEAPRGVLVPGFGRVAEAALGELPAQVAAEAMRTVGQLAAGDAIAWSRVKQARDLRPPLLMARVGIHHRALFRVEAGRLEILDLVTRENLMHTLRRMRRS